MFLSGKKLFMYRLHQIMKLVSMMATIIATMAAFSFMFFIFG